MATPKQINSPQKYATLKFTSYKSAEGFKEKTKSQADIKTYKNGKFGVRFLIDKSIPKSEKRTQRKFRKVNDNTDFDDDINGNGTHWHTAEDL